MDRETLDHSRLTLGARVVIQGFDDIPEHVFLIDEVHEDCICGFAITGPLAGEYGEPETQMILRIID